LFDIFQGVATPEATSKFKNKLEQGLAWGEAKEELFLYIEDLFSGPREEYFKLMNDPKHVDKLLKSGAAKARELSQPFLREIRAAIGID